MAGTGVRTPAAGARHGHERNGQDHQGQGSAGQQARFTPLQGRDPQRHGLRPRRHLGRAFLSPFDVVFTKFDVVEPDLLFVAGDQLDILTKQNVQGPPALVVEIVSPGTRRKDERLKRDLFERGGVREYWLVDPDDDTVRVFRREANGGLALGHHLHRGEQLTTPLLPDLAIELGALFAEE